MLTKPPVPLNGYSSSKVSNRNNSRRVNSTRSSHNHQDLVAMDASRHRRHVFFAQQHSRPLGEVAQRVSKLLPTEEEEEGRGGGYGGGAVENPIGAQNSNNNNNSNNYRNDYDNGDDDDDEKSNKINTEEEEEKNNKDDPASTTTTTTTHLVIHFDINETILVGDEAGGDTVTDSFHKMLAKSAFVQVPTQERMVVQIKQEKELEISNRSKDGTQQQEQEKQQQEQESQAYYYYEKTSHMVPTHWWNGLPIQSSREEYEQYHLNSIDNKNNNINNGEEKSLWNADDNHQQQQEAGEELTGTPSAATTTTTTSALLVPPLYTGWTWPSHCVPYYRTKIRKTMGNDFCNHIGSIYSETFHKMKVTMAETVAAAAAIPATSESTIAAAASSSTAAGTTQQHHCKLFPHLLPAFFETLLFLSSSSTSQNLKWTLVFRTFGSDMTDLAQAVTAFARGQHPLYPNFRDERFVLDEKRQLFRGKWAPRRNGRISSSSSSFEPNNHLLLDRNVDGTTTTSTATTTTKDASSYGADHVYQLWNHAGDTLVASDEDGILDLLHSPEITICGITDDYSFWSANDCQPWAGKPVWKPCSDDGNDRHGQQQQEQQPPINYHHIMFDDNIHNLETDCIASIRRRRQRRTPTQTKDDGKESDPDNDDDVDDYYYESLVPRDSLAQHGVHLIRVPTVEPMSDSQWFIRQIQQARQKFLA